MVGRALPRFGVDDPPREQGDGAPAVDGVGRIGVPGGEGVALRVCGREDGGGVLGRVGGLGAFVEVGGDELALALEGVFFRGGGVVSVEVGEGGEDEGGGVWHFELADCAA